MSGLTLCVHLRGVTLRRFKERTSQVSCGEIDLIKAFKGEKEKKKMEKTWGGKEGEKEIKKEREKEEREREIKREKERERDLILSKVNIVTKYYDHQ